MKLLSQIITYSIAIAITIGVFVAANHSEAKAQENQVNNAAEFAQSLPVTVNKITPTPKDNTDSYPGNIRASRETSLSFRVSGPLVALNAAPGDTVKAGQELIQIDPRDYTDQINVLEAQLVSAKTQLTNAKQDYSRAKKLFNEKVLPQADYDHAVNALSAAEAAIKTIDAQLQIARHKLEDTTLKAPYNCTITEQNVENFEMVSAGKQVLAIQDLSTLEIDIRIPENKIAYYPLHKGAKATVTLPAIANHVFDAQLIEWQSKADPAGRTYKITFAMNRPSDVQVLPGMTANVTLKDSKPISVITIPQSSVLSDKSNNSYVWLYKPESKTARRQPLTINGFYGKDSIVVSSGLKSGDLLITQGQSHVAENAKLNATIIE